MLHGVLFHPKVSVVNVESMIAYSRIFSKLLVIAVTGKGKGAKYSKENEKNTAHEVLLPKKANRKVSETPLLKTATTVDTSVAAERNDSNAVTSDKVGQITTSGVSHQTNATISKTKLLQESSDESSTSSDKDTMEKKKLKSL